MKMPASSFVLDQNITVHFLPTYVILSWVLSAFYFGYLLTQLPGGYLAGRFGSRYVFGIGILMTSVLTLLTSLAAQIHIGALIALRILEGCFEGVTFPAMHSALGRWSPPRERTILSAIVYSGPAIGIVIASPLTAVLCEYGFASGWPSVFYVFGVAGVLWFVFWFFLGFSSPATHPRISKAERLYIESSIASEEIIHDTDGRIPWLSIFKSPPVWAIIISYFCFGWGNFSLITCTPTYFKNVLKLSIGKSLLENGIFSALPYVGFSVFGFLCGPVADLMRRKWLKTVTIRKIFTTIAFLVPAAGLIAVGYLGSSEATCVSFLVGITSFSSLMNSGFQINHIDIAPQYAGIIMGITNTAGTIPGIIGPLVAETIAHKPTAGEDETLTYQEEWRQVFIIAAEINIFGAIIYLLFAKGERQWWAGGRAITGRNTNTISVSIIETENKSCSMSDTSCNEKDRLLNYNSISKKSIQ